MTSKGPGELEGDSLSLRIDLPGDNFATISQPHLVTSPHIVTWCIVLFDSSTEDTRSDRLIMEYQGQEYLAQHTPKIASGLLGSSRVLSLFEYYGA